MNAIIVNAVFLSHSVIHNPFSNRLVANWSWRNATLAFERNPFTPLHNPLWVNNVITQSLLFVFNHVFVKLKLVVHFFILFFGGGVFGFITWEEDVSAVAPFDEFHFNLIKFGVRLDGFPTLTVTFSSLFGTVFGFTMRRDCCPCTLANVWLRNDVVIALAFRAEGIVNFFFPLSSNLWIKRTVFSFRALLFLDV